jgi:hypothetical protein
MVTIILFLGAGVAKTNGTTKIPPAAGEQKPEILVPRMYLLQMQNSWLHAKNISFQKLVAKTEQIMKLGFANLAKKSR